MMMMFSDISSFPRNLARGHKTAKALVRWATGKVNPSPTQTKPYKPTLEMKAKRASMEENEKYLAQNVTGIGVPLGKGTVLTSYGIPSRATCKTNKTGTHPSYVRKPKK